MNKIISIKKVTGGLDKVPAVSPNFGIGVRMKNKDNAAAVIEYSVDYLKKNVPYPCEILEIQETHKPYSRYKYLTIVCKPVAVASYINVQVGFDKPSLR